MDKLKTNQLSLCLDQNLRNDLIDNFEKLQDGIDEQNDDLNAQIKNMLSDIPIQDKNEVTQARTDRRGKEYKTLKSRIDDTQATSETSLSEVRDIYRDVNSAHVNSIGTAYQTLKERLDAQEDDIVGEFNKKIDSISQTPEVFNNIGSLKSKYPSGKLGIFVVADTGHKYIWTGGTWTDAGAYQGVGISDDTKNNLCDLALNADNFIVNGTFEGELLGVAGKNGALISKNNGLLGKKWVSVKSGVSTSTFQGVTFDVKDTYNQSYNDPNLPFFNFSFGIISNADTNLIITINFKDDSGNYTESSNVIQTLYLKKNTYYDLNFDALKYYPKKSFNTAVVIFSDPIDEKINFSISSLIIKLKGV